MLVRNLKEAAQGERRVVSNGWESTRLLLANDNVGFSFNITTIYKDAELHLHYKNHFEAVYCIRGEGDIEDIASGIRYPISEGTLYVLDKHDKHILRAREEMIMACVFNPPLHGKEVHGPDGAYALEAETVED